MTRAHIDVHVKMSLDEAEALYQHLQDILPDESDDRSPQEALLIDIYNGIERVRCEAEKVLAA